MGIIAFVSLVISESQRCLNNLLLQSTIARAICAKNGTLAGIMDNVLNWRSDRVPIELLIFDIKLLFLVTALCSETR